MAALAEKKFLAWRHLAAVLPGGNNDPSTPSVLLPALALEAAGALVERIWHAFPATGLALGLEESAEFNVQIAARHADQNDRRL